jgi:hypothetical protein
MPFLGIRKWDFRCGVLERKPATHTSEALAERYLNNNRLSKEIDHSFHTIHTIQLDSDVTDFLLRGSVARPIQPYSSKPSREVVPLHIRINKTN